MLKYFDEYRKYVVITGFVGVKIDNEQDFIIKLRNSAPDNVEVQFFNAEVVATWEHLYFALLNALMAFKNKRNLSKSLAVEVMLYASAQRQIKKAIDTIGVKCSSNNVAVVIIGATKKSVKAGLTAVANCVGVKTEESVLRLSKLKMSHIKQAFNISDVELDSSSVKKDDRQSLVDLVIERVALLSTQI